MGAHTENILQSFDFKGFVLSSQFSKHFSQYVRYTA